MDERSAVRERQIWYAFPYLFLGCSGTAVVSHSAQKQLFIWQLPGGILRVCVCVCVRGKGRVQSCSSDFSLPPLGIDLCLFFSLLIWA